MAVNHSSNYYRLHDSAMTLHLTRSQLQGLQSKIYKILAKRSRGHREYHVSLFLRGRCWRRLSITSIAAHRRHCVEQAWRAPVVTR